VEAALRRVCERLVVVALVSAMIDPHGKQLSSN
jgi:hypothetical protein